MKPLTEKDFENGKYLKIIKSGFLMLENFMLKLDYLEKILKDGVLITEQEYKRTGKIGHDTNVITKG